MKIVIAVFLSFPFFIQALKLPSCDLAKNSTTRKRPSNGSNKKRFSRISTFSVCTQIDSNCNTYEKTVARIVTATDDGMTLVYTDHAMHNIGFVNITDPSNPTASGVVEVDGLPTSVSFIRDHAIATVSTNSTSGELVAIRVDDSLAISVKWLLDGPPHSVAVSPGGNYVVILINSKIDEEIGVRYANSTVGSIVIVNSTSHNLDEWTFSTVNITGLDDEVNSTEVFDPKSVAINNNNIAAITLQETNAIMLIDLESGTVASSFSAGTVDLDNIDIFENVPRMIDQSTSLEDVPAEPDGITFIRDNFFATADEGAAKKQDDFGGGRSFSIFDICGDLVYNSGSELEQIAASVGHYNDNTSDKRGIELESVSFGTFQRTNYLFVAAHRAGLIFVYDVSKIDRPKFKQVLPTGILPDGIEAIPNRNLLAVASSADSRDDAIRSTISIYKYSKKNLSYPTLKSKRDKETGVAIPWAAISGLTDATQKNLWAISDFQNGGKSSIFKIRAKGKKGKPKVSFITEAINIVDSNDVLAAFPTEPYESFDADDLASMINEDGTVNLDAEGIAHDGENFWICSEASKRGLRRLNFVFKIDSSGVILDVFTLPAALNAQQQGKGFEGIAYADGHIVVAMQWSIKHYEKGYPLVLRYNIEEETWVDNGVYYPTDVPESQNDLHDNWVGINDISYKGDGEFYVIERDNQSGLDAAIKRIYSIKPLKAAEGEILTKTLVKDLILDGDLPYSGGKIEENPEGLAITRQGVWLINDNDGYGIETNLMNLGKF
jgi:hypothetical protein